MFASRAEKLKFKKKKQHSQSTLQAAKGEGVPALCVVVDRIRVLGMKS